MEEALAHPPEEGLGFLATFCEELRLGVLVNGPFLEVVLLLLLVVVEMVKGLVVGFLLPPSLSRS